MDEIEEKLPGGNVAEFVIRVGSTVRKPYRGATASIQALLKHLHEVGFRGAPQAYGIDERGRQVLEFIDGAMWNRSGPPELSDLRRAGNLIRKLHDASSSFVPPVSAHWENPSIPDGYDILCHNDLAPWNLVCGVDRWAFIDWDNAAPATRLWDLAWAAISFPPVEPDCDLSMAARAIHALGDGYGVEPSEYSKLIELMVRRSRTASDLLIDAARSGEQPWARLYAENGDHYWGPTSDYIERSATSLKEMLLSDNAIS